MGCMYRLSGRVTRDRRHKRAKGHKKEKGRQKTPGRRQKTENGVGENRTRNSPAPPPDWHRAQPQRNRPREMPVFSARPRNEETAGREPRSDRRGDHFSLSKNQKQGAAPKTRRCTCMQAALRVMRHAYRAEWMA